jgi:hypothetical protein
MITWIRCRLMPERRGFEYRRSMAVITLTIGYEVSDIFAFCGGSIVASVARAQNLSMIHTGRWLKCDRCVTICTRHS